VARIIDKKLLRSYHDKKCLICNTQAESHHIKSKGSGGHDLDDNLLPLCRVHHAQCHAIGLNRFAMKYIQIADTLLAKGWQFDDYNAKWINYSLLGGESDRD